MRLVFVSINETLNSGLLQSQFVKPAESLVSEDVSVTIINIHRPFRNKYFNDKINVVNLPFLVPFRFINFTSLFFLNGLLTFLYACLICFFIDKNSKMCCRGYVAGSTGYWIKKLFKVKYIFDPRSLYIHENTGYKLNIGTRKYRYWLNLEKKVVVNSDLIISVSTGQEEYYVREYSLQRSKMIVIPCYSSEKRLMSNNEISKIRESLGYKDDDVVVSYLGSLNKGWNNIDLYKEYFNEILSLGHKILIVTQDKDHLQRDDFFINPSIKLLKQGDLVDGEKVGDEFLQVADYGIVLLKETADWFTRLTVKFVDYTSNGLPVIIHKNVGEAYNLSKLFKISPSFTIKESKELSKLGKPTYQQRINIYNWANNYFSIDNAKKILM